MKPFALLFVAAIALLLCQTILELLLPNYMSKVVNVGIVQSGIDDPAPNVLSSDAYDMIARYMDESGRSRMEQAYDWTEAGQATAKLEKKNADMIVANNLKVSGAGFGTDTNIVTLITRDNVEELPIMSKAEVAHAILDKLKAMRGE